MKIEVKDVCKSFRKKQVLDNVNYTFISGNIYGLSGINMNITPDFNEKILEGDIYIKGRVRIYKLLMIVFRVYRNKRFRELVLNK